MSVEFSEHADYPGYRFGSDGSVWSKLGKGPNSRLQSLAKNRKWVKLKPGRHGPRANNLYYFMHFRRKDGVLCYRPVHRLVLEAFRGPPPMPGMVARHFPDPDTSNNAIANLQWGTQKENADDRKRAGNNQYGTKNFNAKLTEDGVREIRAATGRGCVAAMARKYSISRTTIHAIRTRQTWTHVI